MRALPFLLQAAVTTLKKAGDAIISTLWRLKVYGTIKARFLFDAITKSFWCSSMLNYQNLSIDSRIPFYSNALYSSIICESGFSSLLHLINKYRNRLNPSNDLCMALE